MNSEERGSWYLLTGLVLGVILGLVYAWVVQPVSYVDTLPNSLRPEYKDAYRAMIAMAYQGNPNLTRALERLKLLQDADMYRALSEQAQRTLAKNGSAAEARALGLLAISLGQEAPGPGVAVTSLAATASPSRSAPAAEVLAAPIDTPAEVPTEVLIQPSIEPGALLTQAALAALAESSPPAENTPTLAAIVVPPTATFPPRPTPTITRTRTPTATPGAPFLLLSREKVCDERFPAPIIIIEALDRFNQPIAGILVIVTWNGGEERFYTGLKPEKGAGYADFSPAAGILYTVKLGENGQEEPDLAALVCIATSGERHWGAWRLKFVQP